MHLTILIITCTILAAATVLLTIELVKLRRNRPSYSDADSAPRSDDDQMSKNVAVEADRRALTAEFLILHADALERADATLKNIRRKIAAGQTADVNRMLKSETLLDDHTRMFNTTFDRTVFNLYPNFLEQVNALPLPDKQIETPGPNQLTTEMRVLAFACLGIDDTNMIARFLGLSHNTIYTYRNRMRARALDRNTFDRSVQRIGLPA